MTHSPTQSQSRKFENIMIIVIVLFMIVMVALFIKDNTSYMSGIKYKVVDASLIEFNLTSDNIIVYRLKVNMTATNSNEEAYKPKSEYFAHFSYKCNRFTELSMEPFVIPSKTTMLLEPTVLGGYTTIKKLKPLQLDEYNEETRLGIYNLNLYIDPCISCTNLRVMLISKGILKPDTTCKRNLWF